MLITLNALSFSDNKGRFVMREEYDSLTFSDSKWLNMFIDAKLTELQKTFGVTLSVSPNHRESLRIEDIRMVFKLVAKFQELDPDLIFNKRGRDEYVRARWFAMGICADRGISNQIIADNIGFDRITVRYGREQLFDLIESYPEEEKAFNNIRDLVLFSMNGERAEDGSGKLKT